MLTVLLATALLQAHTLPGTTAPPAAEDGVRMSAGANLRTPLTAEEEAQPERVCRMEPVTGSRFPVRVCRSPRSTAANQAESRDMLRRMQGLPELPNSLSGPKTPPAY
ncbi:MAG: hypothetical protein ACT6RD_11920 [Brevundimonas sp.]|uniref:hypothetical protein n=1 Tax=Brevundimonas sp. TaxID=1871086 RepID=UPI004034BFBD